MTLCSNQSIIIKRYAKVVLAFFVMSVLNMSMQIPAHAAMKNQMQQPHVMSEMMVDMANCHCPPSLCDSVLAVEHQMDTPIVEVLTYIMQLSLIESIDVNHQRLNNIQHSHLLFLDVVENSPPTLLIKTLLQV